MYETKMDLKDIIDQLEDRDQATFQKYCIVISKDVINGKITILELIEHLGSLLTNNHASKREIGTLVLTEVLKNTPLDYLNTQQLSVLSDFYSDKLKDHHQILPAAFSGILALLQFKNFPCQKMPIILNSIFHNVPCQQQQRADRYTIFQIFNMSLKLFKEELLAMNLEFVYGVLQSIDGERDPRNLLFLFKWMKLFLQQFPLQHLTEDMFDVLACYFPVDFRAPPNDNSITREALAEALSPCLCAIADFGESCISLAMEKLDSSLEIAKMDSLKLLKEGCLTFQTSVYIEKASEICSLLQKEILSTNSDEIRLECLITFSAVIFKISEDEEGSYLIILQNIFDTLKGNLLPDSKLYEKSAQILVYAGSGSEKACKYITKGVVPILTNIYNMTAYNDQRSTIVKTLVEFAKVHLKYQKSLVIDEVPELISIPLLCLEILHFDGVARKIGFDCLSVLVPYLTTEIRTKLYFYLQTSIFTPTNAEIKHAFLGCLKTTATVYPEEVKSQVFTKIDIQPNLVDPFLKSLGILINLKEFRNYVIEYYLQAIKNAEISKVGIQNTRCLVEKEHNNNGLLKELIDKELVHTLVELVDTGNCGDVTTYQDISAILKIVIANQTSEIQNEILHKYFNTVFTNIHSCELTVLILDGLVTPLRRDINIDNNVFDVCYDLSSRSQNEVVRNVAVQLLANSVNKKTDDNYLLQYLEKLNEKCSAGLSSSSKNTIIISSWITKALLMRNHPHGMIWLDWLMQKLEFYPDVPEGLKIIMNDNYKSLSVGVHCHKSSLYRQRTFVYVTTKICVKYVPSKNAYLRALGYILEFTPFQAILFQFPKIYRFIILCLEKNDEPDILIVLLSIVKSISSSNSALIETHLEDFLTRILNLTTFKPNMRVRIEAIKCLVALTISYPVYKLLPFRSRVLCQLEICVDDKKRFVRKEAMEARSLWFLLDAPV